MFFESFSKGFATFTNVLFFKVHLCTLISVYHPTFLGNDIFDLLGGQEVSDGLPPLKHCGEGGSKSCQINERVNDQSLNRNIGKYNLPHIWDEVLVNTAELILKLTKIAIQHLGTI